MQMQKLGSMPILWANLNITIDTMLKFNANTETDININVQYERTLTFTTSYICSSVENKTRVYDSWRR